MKAIFLRCDRCQDAVVLPYDTVIVPEYSPAAVRSGWQPREPDGWEEHADDEKVVDVCPNCVTGEERADRLFREVAANVAIPLDNEEPC